MLGRAHHDSGAVAVLALLFVLVMGAFLALSFNMGLMLKARGDLQGASDSAALAAAGSIDGTLNGVSAGRAFARQFAAAHKVTGQTVLVGEDADVEYGFWHFRAGEPCAFSGGTCVPCEPPRTGNCPGFEVATNPANEPFSLTAVRVRNGRDDGPTRNSAMVPIFGAFFSNDIGRHRYHVGSDAVAIGRRSQVDCALPIAIAGCRGVDHVFTSSGELDCGGAPREMTFSNTASQDLGWIEFFDPNTPNTADVRSGIEFNNEQCAMYPDIRTGTFPVANGNNLEPIIEPLLGYVNGRRDPDPARCLLGARRTMAVLDNCDGGTPSFTRDKLVVGFVTVEVLAVECASGKLWSVGGTNSCATRPDRNPCTGGGGGGGGGLSLTIRVLCDPPVTNAGGVGSRLRLVR
jgi:hypothetical protein